VRGRRGSGAPFLPDADAEYGAEVDYREALDVATRINVVDADTIVALAKTCAANLVAQHEVMIGFIAQVLQRRTVTGREIRKLYRMCRDTQIKSPPV
jgi:hypothetical protein